MHKMPILQEDNVSVNRPMKPYELCLNLVSLYPVTAGPQLVLFS